MFAGVQGEHDILEVVGMGRSNVDDIDILIGHQVVVGPVRRAGGRNAQVGDEFLGAVRGRRGRDSGDGVGDVSGMAELGVD